MRYAISRPVGGITINTQREYLFHPDAMPMLAPDVAPMLFKTPELAEAYCTDKGIDIENEAIEIVPYV